MHYLSGTTRGPDRLTWHARWPFWVGLAHVSFNGERKMSGLYVRLGDRWRVWSVERTMIGQGCE